MNAQPLPQNGDQKALVPATQAPAQHRLVGLVLFESSRFNDSDTITSKPAAAMMTPVNGAEVSIVPARITGGGDWVPCSDKERPDGFGVEQLRGAGKDRMLKRGFVPWGAVRELIYAV